VKESEQVIFMITDKPIISLKNSILKSHKLNIEIFGNLNDTEYQDLRSDIEARGIQDPLHVVKQNGEYVVVSGHQRLKVARELGIDLPCIIRTDLVEEWQVEEQLIKDNLLRRHLNDYQKVNAGERLEVIEREKAKAEQQKAGELYGKSHPKKEELVPDVAPPIEIIDSDKKTDTVTHLTVRGGKAVFIEKPALKTRDTVARQIGMSHTQYDNAKKVKYEAPEPIKLKWQSGEISTGTAMAAIKKEEKKVERELHISELKEKISLIETPPDTFDIIVIDAPWEEMNGNYDPSSRRSTPGYPTMTVDEIKNIVLPANDDCILFMWTINNRMHETYHILESWGFTPKTILTWVKNVFGLGYWFRGQTEHCIVATKGNPKIYAESASTVINGNRREHSRKPDEFYQLVDKVCIGTKLDYFSREQREGWYQYGNDTERF